MTFFLVLAALALLTLLVVGLLHSVDPDRLAASPFGLDRESLRRPDRDRDRIACELSAIRAHSHGRH